MHNKAIIFQAIFGKQWASLPSVMHKHYANRSYSHDVVTVEGKMTIEVSFFARMLSPLMRIAGALVPYAGQNIPVTVHFRSEPDSNVYGFDRIFYFPGRAPYHFRSRMVPTGGSEVVEYMPIGIGWKAGYRYDGKKVLLEHRGYTVKLMGKMVTLPLELLLGRGYAEEEALSDTTFRMHMDIHHPIFGKVYAYRGEFAVTEVVLNG